MLFNNNLMNGKDAVTKGALIVAFFSMLSRFLGVFRDRILASTFGAGSILDAYYAAFKIPDFIFNTFVLGALASALIPVFIQYRENQGLPQAYALANRVLNLLIIILSSGALLAFVTAPWLMQLIAPGFDEVSLVLAVKLTRLMLLAVVIFGAANVMSSILQAQQRLVSFALAPVMYNLGIILGIFLFVPPCGAIGLGGGIILGSLLHLIVQIPVVWGLGWRPNFSLNWQEPGLMQVIKLLLPRTLGLAAGQINQIVTTSFISTLTVGSLTAFSLALNLQSFPINVFGVSLAIAVFPLLSQAYVKNQTDDFIRYFSQNIRRVLFYAIPLSVLFLILRAQLVRIVLGSGVFDWHDTIKTAQALGFLALAIVSDSLMPLVARTFYALKDTKTPLLAGVISILINFIMLFSLRSYGLAGVGIAYVCASVANILILVSVLGNRLGNLGASFIINGLWRMSLAALAAGASAWGILYLVAPYVNMNTFIGIFSQGLAAGIVGIFSYIVITVALNLTEIEFIRRRLASAWRLLAHKFD